MIRSRTCKRSPAKLTLDWIRLFSSMTIRPRGRESEMRYRKLSFLTCLPTRQNSPRNFAALHVSNNWHYRMDRRRSAMYAEQRQRVELKQSATSLDDYYRSLQMRIRLEPLTPSSITRVAQLTQRTNQLNMTTRRYSTSDIESYMAKSDWSVIQVSVDDRFGSNGIVGAMILHRQQRSLWIDTYC